MFENYPEIVNTRQVTEMLGISKTTLFGIIIAQNEIPHRKIGRNYKFRRQDIENYISSFGNSCKGKKMKGD